MVHHTNNKKNKGKNKKTINNNQPEIPTMPAQMTSISHAMPELPNTIAYQTKTENYNKPKVFVATPCYVGQVHVKYMESVMALQHMLLQNGIGFEFFNIPFDSLIPRARNASVTRFMQSSDATHLLFIDADIQFHPASVIKMLREDKNVICGCYPKKALDFEAVKNNYQKTSNQVELIQSAVRYAYNFKPQRSHKLERGVVEILDAPTGFMMVKKQVIRDMIKQYPHTEYFNDVKAYQVKEDDRFFDLFQSQVFDRRYLSEDYGFCRLWQNMGGQIHADLTVKLNHIGQFCYFGDPIVHLRYSNNVQMSEQPIQMERPDNNTNINEPSSSTNNLNPQERSSNEETTTNNPSDKTSIDDNDEESYELIDDNSSCAPINE